MEGNYGAVRATIRMAKPTNKSGWFRDKCLQCHDGANMTAHIRAMRRLLRMSHAQDRRLTMADTRLFTIIGFV